MAILYFFLPEGKVTINARDGHVHLRNVSPDQEQLVSDLIRKIEDEATDVPYITAFALRFQSEGFTPVELSGGNIAWAPPEHVSAPEEAEGQEPAPVVEPAVEPEPPVAVEITAGDSTKPDDAEMKQFEPIGDLVEALVARHGESEREAYEKLSVEELTALLEVE